MCNCKCCLGALVNSCLSKLKRSTIELLQLSLESHFGLAGRYHVCLLIRLKFFSSCLQVSFCSIWSWFQGHILLSACCHCGCQNPGQGCLGVPASAARSSPLVSHQGVGPWQWGPTSGGQNCLSGNRGRHTCLAPWFIVLVSLQYLGCFTSWLLLSEEYYQQQIISLSHGDRF